MQNQTNTKHCSNPMNLFKSARNFLENLDRKENSSETTVSKVLSKIPNRNKTENFKATV